MMMLGIDLSSVITEDNRPFEILHRLNPDYYFLETYCLPKKPKFAANDKNNMIHLAVYDTPKGEAILGYSMGSHGISYPTIWLRRN